MNKAFVAILLHVMIPLFAVLAISWLWNRGVLRLLSGVVWGILTGFVYYVYATSSLVSPDTAKNLFSVAESIRVYGVDVSPGAFYASMVALMGLMSGSSTYGFSGRFDARILFVVGMYSFVLVFMAIAMFENSPRAVLARTYFDLLASFGIAFAVSYVPTVYWTIVGPPSDSKD
jgi:hypothetical protein